MRNVAADDVPCQINVDSTVDVIDEVPHSLHPLLFNLGKQGEVVVRFEMGDGLADLSQCHQNRISIVLVIRPRVLNQIRS